MKKAFITFCVFCYSLLSHAQTLKQAEYFIDRDKGVGKNPKFNLIASADSSYELNIVLSGITVGIHKLYIRAKDSKGKWSLPVRRNIEVIEPENLNSVTKGEYFFDTDPGYGKAKKITVTSSDSVVVQDFDAITSTLNTGFHKLYTRFKDSTGKWSITSRRNVEIIKSIDTLNVVAAEYFFTSDKGFGKNTIKLFANPSPDGTFSFNIPYNKIPANADTLFIRVADSINTWSLTKLDTFSVASGLRSVAAYQKRSDDVKNNRFKIFPNPARDVINIQSGGKGTTANILILDSKGERIKAFTLPGSGTMQINIGFLASGTYVVRVTDGINIHAVKLVKE